METAQGCADGAHIGAEPPAGEQRADDDCCRRDNAGGYAGPHAYAECEPRSLCCRRGNGPADVAHNLPRLYPYAHQGRSQQKADGIYDQYVITGEMRRAIPERFVKRFYKPPEWYDEILKCAHGTHRRTIKPSEKETYDKPYQNSPHAGGKRGGDNLHPLHYTHRWIMRHRAHREVSHCGRKEKY